MITPSKSWSLCNNGACRCLTISTDDYPVCKVTVGDWGDDYPDLRFVGEGIGRHVEAFNAQLTYGSVSHELALANARLIAAAPELLQALKDCRAAFLALPDGWGEALPASVTPAILKAEGR